MIVEGSLELDLLVNKEQQVNKRSVQGVIDDDDWLSFAAVFEFFEFLDNNPSHID